MVYAKSVGCRLQRKSTLRFNTPVPVQGASIKILSDMGNLNLVESTSFVVMQEIPSRFASFSISCNLVGEIS